MGILDRLKAVNPFAKSKTGDIHRVWSQMPRLEASRLPNLYHQSPRLDSVEMIADAVSCTSLCLYDKKQKRTNYDEAKKITEHPFLDLLETPSKTFPELDGNQLLKLIATFNLLLGEGFVIKVRSGSKIVELLFFPPSWCVTVPTSGNPYFSFVPFGATAGKTLVLPPEDVIWFKKSDISDPYTRGRGRTEALGDELDTDEMMAKYQKNTMYNDGTVPFWANLPGVDKGNLDALKDNWANRLSGWLNARKPAFTNADKLDIVKLGENMKDLDFVESRKFIRDESIHHYKIPPEMFGILDNSNRSTIDAAYYHFAKIAVKPELDFIARVLTTQLLQCDFDARLVCDFDFTVPEDEDFRLKKLNEGVSRGMLTRADWKKGMGYPVLPSDNVYIMPSNFIEVRQGQAIPQIAQTVAPAKEEPEEPKEEPEPEAPKPKEKAYFVLKSEPALDAKRDTIWKSADAAMTKEEPNFIKAVQKFAKAQLSRINIKDYSSVKSIMKGIDIAFVGADEALKHALAPAWLDAMRGGYDHARTLLNKKGLFDTVNPYFSKWVDKEGLQLAKDINTTTYDALRDKINKRMAELIEEGASIDKIAQAIDAECMFVYTQMTEARAELIARTETMRSINFGSIVTYKQSNIEKVEWLATPGKRTREAHRVGQAWGAPLIASIDEGFTIGGEKMMFPGDPNGSAGNSCNCRCTIAPVVEL